jgi:hypothetical protein
MLTDLHILSPPVYQESCLSVWMWSSVVSGRLKQLYSYPVSKSSSVAGGYKHYKQCCQKIGSIQLRLQKPIENFLENFGYISVI